jgi:hypothetical protein
MDRDLIMTIVLAILGSNGFFAVVQLLITRDDTKKNVKGKLERLEKDGLRTQLLLLFLLMPDEKKEILTIAQHYFVKPPHGLGGNWYMTSLFDKWIEKNLNGVKPEWFKTE